jgi:CRISPR-associated protein Csb1
MTEIGKLENLLDDDGPVAIIIKQPLAPVDEDDRIIFPPTYPITDWTGRVHTIRDGDYRVTVELPTGSKANKDEKQQNQKPGYQIDRFPDGTNICEIDSPQSQSNRIEPKFKEIDEGQLVPQVEIQVGKHKVNLLDVGHRAGDALVRMSSLAAEIHEAFTAAKSHDFFKLAILAPTSLVFGVWDSRSTQVKQQRVFKSQIRVTNVREVSRSAQYTPAVAYVDSGAIGDKVEKKTGDESNLSQEGMVHALSTQAVGGVMLTSESLLVRTVNVNIAAVRTLRGSVPVTQSDDPGGGAEKPADCTKELRNYVLGLALVAAFNEPDLSLREGCNLKHKNGQSVSAKVVYRSRPDDPCPFGWEEVLVFARDAKKRFFELAKIDEDAINRPNVIFETGVAEKFLNYDKADRDKIRKFGPITAQTLAHFEKERKNREKGKDPVVKLRQLVEALKTNLAGTKLNEGPVKKLKEHLDSISEGDVNEIAAKMRALLESADHPASKIQALKDLLSPAEATASGDNSGGEEDIGEDSQ